MSCSGTPCHDDALRMDCHATVHVRLVMFLGYIDLCIRTALARQLKIQVEKARKEAAAAATEASAKKVSSAPAPAAARPASTMQWIQAPAPAPVQQEVVMQQQTRLVGYEPKYEYVDVGFMAPYA